MRKIKVNNFVTAVAGGLVQPYYSFLSVISGVGGPLLGVISSASVVVMDVVPMVFKNVRRLAPSFGYLIAALGWFAIGLTSVTEASTVFYLAFLVGLGIASYSIQVLLEPLSRGRRGDVLGSVTQYARLGGITATLVTGFIVGSNYQLNRLFAVITGLLYLVSAVQFRGVVAQEAQGEAGRTNVRLVVANSLFYFVWALAWPVFPVLEVYKFHMDETNLAIISTIGGLSGLVGQYWMNKVINKRPVLALFLGRAALAVYPLAYALASNVYEIYVVYLAMAVTSTSQPALLAVVYNTTRNVRRSLAGVLFWQGIASLAGSVASATLLYSLASTSNVDELVVVATSMMIAISALRFSAATLYVFFVKEESSPPSSQSAN